jgi:hypothetical protein
MRPMGVVERMWRLSMETCAGSVTTVVVPPAPRAPELTAAQLKKNRDREYQRKKRVHARAVPRQRAVDGLLNGFASPTMIDPSAVHVPVSRIRVGLDRMT